MASCGYLTPCLSAKSFWFNCLVGMLVTQLAYGALAIGFPDIFAPDLLTALGTMSVMFVVFLVLAYQAFAYTVGGALLILVGPILLHNTQLLTHWLRDHVSADIPAWFGMALFGVLVVLLLVVVYLMRVVKTLFVTLYVVLTSVAMWVYVRLATIEYPWDRTPESQFVCCDWSENADNMRCPLGIENWHHLTVLVGLLLFGIYMATVYHTRNCCRGRPAKPKYDKLKRSPTPEQQ